MSEVKEKDRILQQLSAYVHHSQIKGLMKYLHTLKSDGYAEVWLDERGGLISVRLTAEGKEFMRNGGYAAVARRKQKVAAQKYFSNAINWVLGIIAALIVAYLSKRLGWI